MNIASVITAILSMIQGLLPAITSSANANMIDSIITALSEMVPFIINEIQSLVGPVQNIIAALSANPATTAAQLAQLQALDVQLDAAFDAAAADTDAGK
jgi:hypothetical protein